MSVKRERKCKVYISQLIWLWMLKEFPLIYICAFSWSQKHQKITFTCDSTAVNKIMIESYEWYHFQRTGQRGPGSVVHYQRDAENVTSPKLIDEKS